MNTQPNTRDAYDLLHRGAVALNRIQADGMRVDVAYLQHQARLLKRKQARAEETFYTTELGRRLRQRYGVNANIGSDQQLSHLLFKGMGLTPTKTTAKGGASVTRDALEGLDVPGIPELIEWRKLDKTLGTYILGLLKEQAGGVLRPFFHLGQARTFRSSSSSFNFQNIPARDPEQGRTVRQAILPWPGARILEADYGGLEVRIAACYHQDPTMLEYLTGKGDMHRDMAGLLFRLGPKQVTKDVRFHVKNGWVFAEFYGSWYRPCAETLWARIDQFQLQTADSVPLKVHLKKEGIKNYSAFEKHCQGVEDEMWNRRFPVYRDWRFEQVERYERDGYVELKTGFRCYGPMARNDIINYPVQGAAFHCLLWSLTRLDEIRRAEGWKTRMMGQIHDSIVTSLVPEETDHVLNTLFRVSQHEVREAWPWIVVPLEVEAEAAGVDESWHEKTGVVKQEGSCHSYWRKKGKAHLECLTCGGKENVDQA